MAIYNHDHRTRKPCLFHRNAGELANACVVHSLWVPSPERTTAGTSSQCALIALTARLLLCACTWGGARDESSHARRKWTVVVPVHCQLSCVWDERPGGPAPSQPGRAMCTLIVSPCTARPFNRGEGPQKILQIGCSVVRGLLLGRRVPCE